MGGTAQVRKHNAELIREILHGSALWTKDTLARQTGLSPGTCRTILLEMLKQGEVTEEKSGKNSDGRPARYFRYNPDYALMALLGFSYEDGRRYLRFSLADLTGAVRHHEEEILPAITLNTVCSFLKKRLAGRHNIRVLVVSYPGVVHHNGTIGNWGDIDELFGVELQRILQEQFALPVAIDNDINLAAVGYSGGTGNLAYIGFPEKHLPGCGLIVDGHLLRGTRGFAGEIIYIQNRTWEEQKNIISKPHGIAEMLLPVLRAVTALLDPEFIIIAGRDISAGEQEFILAGREKLFMPEILPELIFLPDYSGDNCKGMIETGRALLRSRNELPYFRA